MTTLREAAQQALEAMDKATRFMSDSDYRKLNEAITALRAALEQPEQEPVAWRNAALRVGEDLCSVGPFGYYNMTAKQWLDWALSVVTVHAPPRREWRGLTDTERAAVQFESFKRGLSPLEFMELHEAKLKERNA